jgi:hypothetical protein
VIVPTPTESPKPAFNGFERLTMNCSSISSSSSPFTVTVIVLVVSPGEYVRVPLVLV